LAPLALRPQELFIQVFPGLHWLLSAVQVDQHWVASWHRKGAQVCAIGLTQVPLPSHIEAPMMMLAEALQLGGLHWVVAGHLRHCPAPSQVPSLPQLSASCGEQSPCPAAGFIPAGTGWQVPSMPETLQAEQVPSQEVSQQ
jgi:hypothetical protein